MKKIYVIADIHGDLDRLVELMIEHQIINTDFNLICENSFIVFLGDYTHRAPQSYEVIEFIVKLKQNLGSNIIFTLAGNHDLILLAKIYMELNKYDITDSNIIKEIDTLWSSHSKNDDVWAKLILNKDILTDWFKDLILFVDIEGFRFQHADSIVFYHKYGHYNNLSKYSYEVLFGLCCSMCDRRHFEYINVEDFEKYLNSVGINRIYHGHTPHKNKEPLLAYNGKAINCDACISSGFSKKPNRGLIVSLDLKEL